MENYKVLTLTEDEKLEKIEEVLENMDDSDLVDGWNRLCTYSSDEVHPIEDIDNEFEGYTVREAFEYFDLSKVDFSCAWYSKTGGDLETSDYPTDFFDLSEFASIILERDDDLGDDEIRDILDALDPDEVEELTPEEEAEEVAYWSTEGEPEQVADPEQEERKTYTVTLSGDDLSIILKALDVLYIRLAHAKHDIKEKCVSDWASKCARALDLLHDVEKEETR